VANGDRRVEVVEEHVRLENDHDFPACIGKFGRARYEVVAGDETFDGEARVEHFLKENKRAFPDFHFTATRISPATEAVVVEGRFTGTQNGFWRGLPPTGRKVDFPMCVIFDFEGDVMVNERIYFDLGTALQQLGVQFDPNTGIGKFVAFVGHPLTIIRGLLRAVVMRVTHRRK
jgi:predicted ester cyclase